MKVNVSVSCVISCTKSGGAHDFVMEAAEARDGDDDAAKTAQYRQTVVDAEEQLDKLKAQWSTIVAVISGYKAGRAAEVAQRRRPYTALRGTIQRCPGRIA